MGKPNATNTCYMGMILHFFQPLVISHSGRFVNLWHRVYHTILHRCTHGWMLVLGTHQTFYCSKAPVETLFSSHAWKQNLIIRFANLSHQHVISRLHFHPHFIQVDPGHFDVAWSNMSIPRTKNYDRWLLCSLNHTTQECEAKWNQPYWWFVALTKFKKLYTIIYSTCMNMNSYMTGIHVCLKNRDLRKAMGNLWKFALRDHPLNPSFIASYLLWVRPNVMYDA